MFIGKFNKSVILAYIGVALAIIGCYFALFADIKFAFICLIIAGVCDLFDGVIARSIKRTVDQKLFGIEIDSLADMINFVMLPIIICFGLGLNSFYHIIIYIFYTLTSITRLAYFNIQTDNTTPIKYYTGLPVTYAALILPLVYLLSLIIPISVFNIIYTLSMLLVAVLFILNIKIAKPKGLTYLFFAIIALLASIIISIFG